MIETKNIEGKTVRFQDMGQGRAVVLLHGYLESLEIWRPFAQELAKRYRVIAIDLPGHGQTATFGDMHSMELMADVVKDILDYLTIDRCVLFGHSMGGYVTLAFVEAYPERVNGFCLFHSGPGADNEEKRANRDRQIKLIEEGKSQQLFNTHFPKTFAYDNVARFEKAIEAAKAMAAQTPEPGIIATIRGMKTREDRSDLLANTTLPVLYVLGLKDNFIPSDVLNRLKLPPQAQTLILEHSGHNGFLEQPDKALPAITAFIESI